MANTRRVWYWNVGQRIQIEGRPVQSAALWPINLHLISTDYELHRYEFFYPTSLLLALSPPDTGLYECSRPKKGMNDHIATATQLTILHWRGSACPPATILLCNEMRWHEHVTTATANTTRWARQAGSSSDSLSYSGRIFYESSRYIIQLLNFGCASCGNLHTVCALGDKSICRGNHKKILDSNNSTQPPTLNWRQ